MKRFLLTTLLVWSQLVFGQSEPITSLQGDQQTTKFTSPKVVVPNQQATKTALGGRIETGNKNLLKNPSHESSIAVDDGWTCSGGGTSAASTTVNVQDGKQSVIRTSTGAWSCYQDVTINATGKSGQEAELSVWVYSATALADIWVCPRINGSGVTASIDNGCQQYTNLGSPQKLTVFPLFGSTSTGIDIKGAGAITYARDDAYLGDRRPFIKGITTAPETDCTFSTLAWQGFGTVTNNLKCSRIGQNLIIRNTFTTGTTTASVGQIPLPNNWGTITTTSSVTTNSVVGTFFRNATTTIPLTTLMISASSSVISMGTQIIGPSANATTPAAANSFLNSTEAQHLNGSIIIPIAEWQGDTNGFTTKCDNPKKCETVFSFSVMTTSGAHTKENLDFIASCTAANPTVCTFNTGIFTVAPNCTGVAAGGSVYSVIVNDVTSTYVQIYSITSNTAGAAASIPAAIVCQKQGVDYTNSRIAQQVIQMRGVPQIKSYAGLDIISVSYGTTNATTVCSASPCSYLDQIDSTVSSITRSGAGIYSLNLTRTYSKLKCTIAPYRTVFPASPYHCNNCNALPFNTENNIGAATDSYGTINCFGAY